MIRIWSSAGPRLEKDAAWSATLLGLVAFLAWQMVAMILAAAAFFGRASGQCLIGPECSLVEGWGDGLVGFVALTMVTLSLVVLSVVGRVTVAVVRRLFWAAVAVRVIGWVTLVAGLLGILGWGLPWLVLGIYLVVAGKRLMFETPETGVIEAQRV